MSKCERFPKKAHVTGKEKRQKPTKHYVFIVQVRWSDDSKVPIFRQYSDFHQFHNDLQEFVISLPNQESSDITLPIFPAKKAFERAEISKAASVRRHAFDGYCQSILSHETLAKSKIVCDFFLPRYEDINPKLEAPQKERRRSSVLTALTLLFPSKEDKKTSLVKSRSGEDIPKMLKEEEADPIYVSSPLILESYLVLADYMPQEKGEVQLKEEHYVQVIEKHTNGWWFLSTEYGDGWGPATHLRSLDETDNDEPDPIYSGSKYITTNTYEAPEDAKDEISFPEGALIDVLHKLMDGWWVIKYQGQVGYAPATYLAPFKNPHYQESRYGLRQNKRPTRRRTTIKNSKGKTISSVRDKSRDLNMYRKLSQEKTPQEAKDAHARTRSVKFKDESPENSAQESAVNCEDSADGKVPAKKSMKARSSQQGIRRKKMPLQKSMSVESYEYIDDDELEDINSWVDESVLKRKQEEEAERRDYVNIPKIFINDADENLAASNVPTPSQNLPSESDKKGKAPPPPPSSGQQETEFQNGEHTPEVDESTAEKAKAPPPPSGARKHLAKSQNGDQKPDDDDSVVMDKENEQFVGSMKTCTNYADISFANKNEIPNSEISTKKAYEQGSTEDKSDGYTQPEAIDNVLKNIRSKKISRIYKNENGEIVIQFADPKDVEALGTCDIREESCPVEECNEFRIQTKDKPEYAKVNKPLTDGNKTKVKSNQTSQEEEDNSGSEPEVPTKNLNKADEKTRNTTKGKNVKTKKVALPDLGGDEFAIYV